MQSDLKLTNFEVKINIYKTNEYVTVPIYAYCKNDEEKE